MYLLTLLSPMSMPSLSSSPWMRGAPQLGFSRDILRIRSRTSREMTGRPGWPCRTFQVQNQRKPARCQAMTVSGLTIASAERQSLQRRDRQIHNRRSLKVNFGRFLADLCSTPIWWRRAKFSSSRAARERNIGDRVARSVVRAMSIGENYERNINPHPLRHFEIFARHNSCFRGNIRFADIRKATPRRERLNLECSVILMSACQDNQVVDGRN